MSQTREKLLLELSQALSIKTLKLTTAESCTGGGLAYWLTSISGSSAWFERGFVTYSNQAKIDMLGVPSDTLMETGAVSAATAKAMAEGALHQAQADISVAITGIAGPTGGTKEKPVGTVWFGYASHFFATQTICQVFSGNRAEIREQAILTALETLVLIFP